MDAAFDSSFASLRRLIVSFKVRVAENDVSAASSLSAAVAESARTLLVSRGALEHADVAAFLEADFAPPSIAMLLAIRRACEAAVVPPLWMSPPPPPPRVLSDAGAAPVAVDDEVESLIAGSSVGGSVGTGGGNISTVDEVDDTSFVTALSSSSSPEWPPLTAALPLPPDSRARSADEDSVRDVQGDESTAGANGWAADDGDSPRVVATEGGGGDDDDDYARVIYGIEYGVPALSVCDEDDDGAVTGAENDGGGSAADDEEFIETAPRVPTAFGEHNFDGVVGGGGSGSASGMRGSRFCAAASSPATLHPSARSPTLETPHERSRPPFFNALLAPLPTAPVQVAAPAAARIVPPAAAPEEGGAGSPAGETMTSVADEGWVATARVAHDRIRALAQALAASSADAPSGSAVRAPHPQSRRRSIAPPVAHAPAAPPRIAPRVALASHGQALSSAGAHVVCNAAPAPAAAPLMADPEAARARARAIARVKAVRSKEMTERKRLAADAHAAAAVRFSERDKRIAAFVERHRTGSSPSTVDGFPLRASSPPHANPAPIQHYTYALTTTARAAEHAAPTDVDNELNLSLGDLLPPDVT